jgi:hypothetical protein
MICVHKLSSWVFGRRARGGASPNDLLPLRFCLSCQKFFEEWKKSLGRWVCCQEGCLGVPDASNKCRELFSARSVKGGAKRKGNTAVDATTILPIGKQDACRSRDRDAARTMKTKTQKPKKPTLIQCYRALGLKRGECRIDVIRSAATEYVRHENHESHLSMSDFDRLDERRARVALATYRLLDPRNRTDLYERVQLSCPLNEEEIQQPVADFQSPLNRNIVVYTPPRSKEPVVNIMNTDVVNRAIEEAKSFGKEQDQNARSTVAESEPSLSERRQVVRLLREIELAEVPPQSSSPLAWLRSYLGL